MEKKHTWGQIGNKRGSENLSATTMNICGKKNHSPVIYTALQKPTAED